MSDDIAEQILHNAAAMSEQQCEQAVRDLMRYRNATKAQLRAAFGDLGLSSSSLRRLRKLLLAYKV